MRPSPSGSTVVHGGPIDPPSGRILGSEFFARSSELVASGLIGKILWRTKVGGGRLTEVEAYLPEADPASHAASGPTRRNAAMFGPPGTLYVFLSYGVHLCLNLVCDQEQVGSAVLIRAFEPLGDTRRLRANRTAGRKHVSGIEKVARKDDPAPAGSAQACPTHDGPAHDDPGHDASGHELCCGPGRVGQALALDLDMNGLALGEASGLYVIDDGALPDGTAAKVGRRGRIGISKGDDLPLRFVMIGSKCVSREGRAGGGRKR